MHAAHNQHTRFFAPPENGYAQDDASLKESLTSLPLLIETSSCKRSYVADV